MLLKELIETQDIIIAPGAYDVVSAQIIEQAGFPIAYITGLGNEASDLGCPDLGLTTDPTFYLSNNISFRMLITCQFFVVYF